MARLITVGDLHLTDASGVGCLSKYVENSDDVVLGEVTKVLDYAQRKNVDQIAFLGDLCDGPRMSYEAFLRFLAFLRANKDFTFHMYPGNHDMFSADPAVGHSLQLLMEYQLPNVRIYTTPTVVRIGGAKFRFLPFPHASFKPGMLNLAHVEVYGSKNDAGRVNKHEELSRSKAVACIGHLHTAHQVRNCYYGGTLLQNNFGESLPKFFQDVEYNSDDDYEVTAIENDPAYKLHTIVLQSKADLKGIPKGKNNLVKLVIEEGADVVAGDYAHFSNVQMVKAFRNKEELAAVLTEDLSDGKSLIVRTDDFFREWIKSLDVEASMRKRVRQTRQRILEGLQA